MFEWLARARIDLLRRLAVRREIRAYRRRYGERAYDTVLRKLRQDNLTSRYRALLVEVEKGLRPKA